MSLKNVFNQLEDINSYPGRLDKETLVKKYADDILFKKVVLYAMDNRQFNTSRVFFKSDLSNYKEKDSRIGDVEMIFKMLDYLSTKRGATNEEIEWLSIYSSIDEETVEVVSRIINKDLRCGASIKTFIKFIPEIPIYDVMLCEKDLDKYINLCDIPKSLWSEKLDGVRCTVYYNNGKIKYISRNGKEFLNFSIFDNYIHQIYEKIKILYKNDPIWINRPLDGEMIARGKTKKEKKTYQKLMTQVQRIKDIDPSLFEFNVFDIIVPDKILSERLLTLINVFSNIENSPVKYLTHYMGFKNEIELINFVNDRIDNYDWEGIVLKNPNSYYEFKRSRAWCKVKKFYTIDANVLGFNYGKPGKKYEQVVGSLLCEYNSKKFNCGSGFSDLERQLYLTELPPMIEVKYQELTKDGIPRFPIFVRVRTDK